MTAPTLTVTSKHRDDIRKKAKAGTLAADDFDSTVYGAKAVRQALHEMQNEKCAYCEKPIESEHANVDHFRPKTRATERDRSGRVVSKRPGYYWRAYAFDNLFLTCPNCNTAKSDQFPLRPMKSGSGKNTARLLDPCRGRPRKHITFVHDPIRGGFVPTYRGAVDGPGDHTLRILRLDRDGLLDLRGKAYRKHIKPLIDEWNASPTPARAVAIKAQARELTSGDSEYSAMNRAAFKAAGIL